MVVLVKKTAVLVRWLFGSVVLGAVEFAFVHRRYWVVCECWYVLVTSNWRGYRKVMLGVVFPAASPADLLDIASVDLCL